MNTKIYTRNRPVNGLGTSVFKPHHFSGNRVLKCQYMRMQPQPADGIARRTVFFIANNRMADIFHMYSNLIFSAGLQTDFQQGIPGNRLEHFKRGYCLLSVPRSGTGIYQPRFRFFQPRSNRPLRVPDLSFDYRHISAVRYDLFPGILEQYLTFSFLANSITPEVSRSSR